MRIIIDEEQRAQCYAGLELQKEKLMKLKKSAEDAGTMSSRTIREIQDQIDIIKGVDDDPGLLALYAKEGSETETRHGKPGTLNMFDEMSGGDRSTHNAAVDAFNNSQFEDTKPATRFDREEGSLTVEQIAHGLALGPWRDTWDTHTDENDAETVTYRAHVPATENEAERIDTETPRNEAEARSRAAWLNLVESGTIEAVDFHEGDELEGDDDNDNPEPTDDDEDEAIQDEALESDEGETVAEEGREGQELSGSDAEPTDGIRIPVSGSDAEAGTGALIDSIDPEAGGDPYLDAAPKRRRGKKA